MASRKPLVLGATGRPAEVADLDVLLAAAAQFAILTVTGTLRRSTSANLAPTGSTLATALVLPADLNVVTTTANGSALKLTANGIGSEILVINMGGNQASVYPPTTGSIINALSAGSPFLMATLARNWFIQFTATQFYSVNG